MVWLLLHLKPIEALESRLPENLDSKKFGSLVILLLKEIDLWKFHLQLSPSIFVDKFVHCQSSPATFQVKGAMLWIRVCTPLLEWLLRLFSFGIMAFNSMESPKSNFLKLQLSLLFHLFEHRIEFCLFDRES